MERPPAENQEQIGRTLLSHVEKLRALRAEIDKGIRSLDAGRGRSPASTISSGKRTGRRPERSRMKKGSISRARTVPTRRRRCC